MSRRLADVPVGSILIPRDGLREADRDWVEALAVMMAEAGQLQPIEVGIQGDGYVLVFGLHRLAAARKLGWDTIAALVDDQPGDDGSLQLRAAMENVARRELSMLDRAVHVATLHQETKARVGERRGGDRRGNLPPKPGKEQKAHDEPFALLGLSELVADRVLLSPAQVKRSVAIATGIGPAVRRRIVGTPQLEWLADDQTDLLLLARGSKPPAEPLAGEELEAWQKETLTKIERGEADSVAGAMAGKRPESNDEKWRRRVHTGLTKLSIDGRYLLFDEFEQTIREWARKRGWRP